MIEITDIDQNTDEWIKIRLGVATASNFERIVKCNGEPSKSAKGYMIQLAGEILSGEPHKSYYSYAMKLGHEREPESRALYEFNHDVDVRQVGFVFYNEDRRIGCSPDGLIDPNGGFESKNAEPAVQITRHEDGWSKADHFQQVQGGLWICEREWWDLQSYSRGIAPIVIRFYRDESFINTLRIRLLEFIDEFDEFVDKLRKK